MGVLGQKPNSTAVPLGPPHCETLAPHYDALDFTLGVRARGGRVVYCGACVVRRLSGRGPSFLEGTVSSARDCEAP